VLTVKSILGIIPQLIVVMGSIVTIMLITLTGNSITYTQVGVYSEVIQLFIYIYIRNSISILR